MDRETASSVSNRLVRVHKEMRDTVAFLKTTCNENEYKRYGKQPAMAMTTIGVDILEPIWREHPHLRPPEAAD
jgi:hypothetical protein